MIVKKEKLQAYLDKHEMTAATLARDMGIDENEVKTLLNGGAVNEATARPIRSGRKTSTFWRIKILMKRFPSWTAT